MNDREKGGYLPDTNSWKRSRPTAHQTDTLPSNPRQTSQDSGSGESSSGDSGSQIDSGGKEGEK